jgi:hypothetical protein
MGVSLLAADNCFVACDSVESRDISINGVAFKALVVRACQVNLRCAEHTRIGHGGGVCKSLPLTHYTAAPPGWHVLSYETKPFIWHGGPRTLNVNISGDERVEFYVRDKRIHHRDTDGAVDFSDGKSRYDVKASISESERGEYEHVQSSRVKGISVSAEACSESWWGAGGNMEVEVYAIMVPLAYLFVASKA